MIKYKENASLLPHNTFGFDVKASMLVEYNHEDDLPHIFSDERVAGRKFLHIGQGSNLLFVNDFDGVVLHSRIKGIKIASQSDDMVLIECGAGEVWDDLCQWCVQHGFYGLENLSGIPGEVGAAAVQNIGAYGAEFGDLAVAVAVYDVVNNRHAIISAADCQYGYRMSIFKTDEFRNRFVVTSVLLRVSRNGELNLEYGNIKAALLERGYSLTAHLSKRASRMPGVKSITLSGLREVILAIRQSKLPDPAVFGNAGSFFKNPVISSAKYKQLSATWPDMPKYDVDADFVKVPAAWLIERSGCKGRRIGDAAVYDKQCLVLVNRGKARPEEVVKLSDAIIRTVSDRFGITIEPEVNII
ncbi:MAG: UDP-N-acetylmuramate dehydrogenase [Bacteroidales bacterium]|nr:UDP-N-acetylmuramate dehydrogenase [Candidatus Liminaster caballi]